MASDYPILLFAISMAIIFFVLLPLAYVGGRAQDDNKTNNTNKTLGEWMTDNKGITVLSFLLGPGLILAFITFMFVTIRYEK